MQQTHQNGFTLVELMIAIMVLAVTIAIAVPSFKSQIESSRREAALADFITGMAYARAESVKQGKDIYLRSVSNDGSWSEGWCVTGENNCNGEVVRTFGEAANVTLKATNTSTNHFAFNSLGFLGSESASISLCMSNSEGKKIVVTPQGQALAVPCSCSDEKVCQ